MALVETTMSLDEISIASIEIILYYLSSAHLTGGPKPEIDDHAQNQPKKAKCNATGAPA
ncbi:hypothetical protein [Hydrogenophaga sp.]|uniref:hypothetical protein n=1 Tax=Hydrogenophaga sp. TaxID=1904254 RepID=UPI002728A010|nr:hypothetical protein [Hydrogenophaga sp.]MDO9131890.1 hypothetical protein [Hydrogenophaga sp.]